MSINLDNLSLNINFRIILIKTINNNVREDLFTRISIKTIKNLITQAIKVINNDFKLIKTIKKTLVSRYSLYQRDFRL